MPVEDPYDEFMPSLPDTRLRVLTWNVWGRSGPWEARQPGIQRELQRLRPDLVALQEVWEDDDTNQAAQLAATLGYDHVFASRLTVDGVRYGNAVLSAWPILRSDWRPLPAGHAPDEGRLVLFVEADGPRGPVQLFCTHLNWRLDHGYLRKQQVAELCGFVAAAGAQPFPPVLCGDLNATPDSDEIRMLTGRAAVPVAGLAFHDAWEMAGDGGPGFTWSNSNPFAAASLEASRRIDYVFVGWRPEKGAGGTVIRASIQGELTFDGVEPSDHYAVLAELAY